ncbi:MAG: aspartate kinase, partial [Gammaproteobacteria bacterium]|nr:aspartate kinase [Gammaproteobacteria bacterium]
MSLIVQKYGGTSVATVEKIGNVADKVAARAKSGDKVVVAVSAMSGETNRLIALAKEMSVKPHAREMDVIISTGEQVTIALLTMALLDRGCDARSYTGAQIRMV